MKPNSAPVPGRVAIDDRGRNVWQWNDNQLDSTTIMLQRLDNSALTLEPTFTVRRARIQGLDQDQPAPAERRSPNSANGVEIEIEQTFSVKLGGGFDPYNRS